MSKKAPAPRIVHQGRGGYIEIDGARYAIEHVGGGRFCIEVPSDAAHLEALQRLVDQDPMTWALRR
jgi:hypothetical protein